MLSLPTLHQSIASPRVRAGWMVPLPANALIRTQRAQVIKDMLARGVVSPADVVAAMRDGSAAAWSRLHDAYKRDREKSAFKPFRHETRRENDPAPGSRGATLALARALADDLRTLPGNAIRHGSVLDTIKGVLAARSKRIRATLPKTLRLDEKLYDLLVSVEGNGADQPGIAPLLDNIALVSVNIDRTTAAGRVACDLLEQAIEPICKAIPWAGIEVLSNLGESMELFYAAETILDLYHQTGGILPDEAAFVEAAEDGYIPGDYSEFKRLFAEVCALNADEAPGDRDPAPAISAAIAAFAEDCRALAEWLAQWGDATAFEVVENLNEDGAFTALRFDALPPQWSATGYDEINSLANQTGFACEVMAPKDGGVWDSARVDTMLATTIALNVVAALMHRAARDINQCCD